MHFVIVGLSHKTAPVDIRERLSIPEAKIRPFLNRLLEDDSIEEGMVLSTCNRVETYVVTRQVREAIDFVKGLFSEHADLSLKELDDYLYIKDGKEAIQHVFCVTSSLDSMIVGEPQISGQIKEAYSHAVESETTGSYLNKLVHRALNVSKKVRTETSISQHPVSISYAAVLLAEKIFGDLSSTQILLLGAGEMGTLAARHLVERKVGRVWISNRTGEKAIEAAMELGAAPVPYDQLFEHLPQVDILIVSTGAAKFVIPKDAMIEVMRKRKNKPMFLIDIAVPRNIDPEIHEIENVYLFDIDHLKGIVESNRKEREKEAKKAEAIIFEEVHQFLNYIHQMELSPTIQQLSKKFDAIRRGEMEKYLPRLSKLSSEEKEAVEGCTRAIVNKILHEPIILMKTEEIHEGGVKYSEILKKLFKLEGEG